MILASLLFRIRAIGRRNVPREGGVIIACSHQSYLDPPLVGLLLPRQIHYLARASLFTGPRAFAWLMRSLNAIPVRREGGDRQSYRESVRRLRAGEAVLMFPEGTRTPDGEIGPLRPGVWNLARRAGVPVVPAVIDGAFEAWPRNRLLPRPAPIRVLFGRPIPAAAIAATNARAFSADLAARLADLLARSRAITAAVGSRPKAKAYRIEREGSKPKVMGKTRTPPALPGPRWLRRWVRVHIIDRQAHKGPSP